MFFGGNLFQTYLVISMSSRQDHKICICTSRYFVQRLFKWCTDHLGGSRLPCMIRIHRAVFQYDHLTIHHHCNFDHRNRHMPCTADYNLFFLSQRVTEYSLIFNGCNSTFCNILYFFRMFVKITIFPAFPCYFSIYDQCFFRNGVAFQHSKYLAVCPSFTLLNCFY